MKEGWEVKKLGEVMKLQSGENLPAKKMQDGIYPVYGGNGVSGYHNDYNMMGENIIIGRVGALCGNVRYLRDPFWLTDNGFKVILNKGLTVDLRYLTLFLNFANLRQYAKQTAQPVISNVALQEVPVILPPLPEQERIVEILDAEFAKIDAVKAGAEKSLQHAKDLFQAALKKELTPKEGWETKKLKEIANFYNGKPHENDIDENGEFTLVNSKFISSDMRILKRTSVQLFPLFVNDIVMVMSDVPKGKALAKCQIIQEDNKYSLNQRICVFRNAKINTKLLYYLINRNPYLLAFDNGENQTNLRKNDIISMPLSYPNDCREALSIISRLDNWKDICKTLQANYERTIALCDDMKQALLRKAFNGEL